MTCPIAVRTGNGTIWYENGNRDDAGEQGVNAACSLTASTASAAFARQEGVMVTCPSPPLGSNAAMLTGMETSRPAAQAKRSTPSTDSILTEAKPLVKARAFPSIFSAHLIPTVAR
jgi:hypothetical protein